MLEQSESKTVSELMQLARTVAVLDRGAMEELMAKQDAAISAGLADESLRYHLLDILLQRALSEYQPESRKESTCQPCRLLDEVVVNEHLFLRNKDEFAGAVAVPVCEDVELNCYYHCPDQEALTLVHFHGGDESVAGLLRSEFPHRLQQLVGNVNLLLVEYRGYSGSQGHPRLVRMLRDGEMVLNALGVYPSRCIVYGRAIGSVYALELAFRQKAILGLVLEEPISDLAEFFMRSEPLMQILKPRWHEVEKQLEDDFDQENKLATCQNWQFFRQTASRYESLVAIKLAIRHATKLREVIT